MRGTFEAKITNWKRFKKYLVQYKSVWTEFSGYFAKGIINGADILILGEHLELLAQRRVASVSLLATRGGDPRIVDP